MFTGEENHDISLNDAAALTGRYRSLMGENDIKGGFFGRDAIEEVLAQTGCVGIRYYYGLSTNGKQVLVLVGANADGDDLTEGVVLEFSVPCPAYCATNNDLNS